MSKEDKKNVYNQMAWILNYQPIIREQHIHMGDKPSVDETKVEPQKQAEEAGCFTKEHQNPQQELNFFAPQKHLQELLKGMWFAELRTNEKYDATWIDGFIEALMASEYGEEIARQWAVKGGRKKYNQLKGYVLGLLKDAGVLKGSYDSIAKRVALTDKPRTVSRAMSDGKRQPYAEWVKAYVTENENESKME